MLWEGKWKIFIVISILFIFVLSYIKDSFNSYQLLVAVLIGLLIGVCYVTTSSVLRSKNISYCYFCGSRSAQRKSKLDDNT